MDAIPAPTDDRLRRATTLIESAVQTGANLIVLPELFNTGYTYAETNYAVAETITGTTVTWLNEDSAFHSVTSGFYDAPTELFDSGHMDPFESFSYTFSESGIYDYYCTLHPWMEAQVIVE